MVGLYICIGWFITLDCTVTFTGNMFLVVVTLCGKRTFSTIIFDFVNFWVEDCWLALHDSIISSSSVNNGSSLDRVGFFATHIIRVRNSILFVISAIVGNVQVSILINGGSTILFASNMVWRTAILFSVSISI